MYGDAFAAAGRTKSAARAASTMSRRMATRYGVDLRAVLGELRIRWRVKVEFREAAAQRRRAPPHPTHRITDVGDARRHRLDRERLRLDGRDLFPAERRRDARVRRRPNGIRRRDRAIARVLAEVD